MYIVDARQITNAVQVHVHDFYKTVWPQAYNLHKVYYKVFPSSDHTAAHLQPQGHM